MMNMVYGNKEAEPYFITDIERKDDRLIITHADKSVEDSKYSDRNLGFYRHKMIDQARKYLPAFTIDLSKESFKVYVKRVGAIIGGILGMFLLYNIDIHTIMKIVLTILIILGELAYYIWNEIVLSVISDDCRETLATEYYLANLRDFQYYDQEKGIDGYIVPPEDISNHKLDNSQLKQMSETIKDFKSQGVDEKDISLTYKKINRKVEAENE